MVPTSSVVRGDVYSHLQLEEPTFSPCIRCVRLVCLGHCATKMLPEES